MLFSSCFFLNYHRKWDLIRIFLQNLFYLFSYSMAFKHIGEGDTRGAKTMDSETPKATLGEL